MGHLAEGSMEINWRRSTWLAAGKLSPRLALSDRAPTSVYSKLDSPREADMLLESWINESYTSGDTGRSLSSSSLATSSSAASLPSKTFLMPHVKSWLLSCCTIH
jgi:hypothetical protein